MLGCASEGVRCNILGCCNPLILYIYIFVLFFRVDLVQSFKPSNLRWFTARLQTLAQDEAPTRMYDQAVIRVIIVFVLHTFRPQKLYTK